MMGHKTFAPKQLYAFSLEERVPADHLLRQVSAVIVRGAARKGRVVGCNLVELAPDRDVNGISALTAYSIIRNLIGEMVRSGYW